MTWSRTRVTSRGLWAIVAALGVIVPVGAVARMPSRGSAPADESANRLDWWSLHPVVRPLPPAVSDEDSGWVRTPIDAFIADRLRHGRLAPSDEACRGTLIRPLHFLLH